ncbi:MAG: TldD/PmbA family protein [Patescibacteria group bacterium]|nr:TldD/PmbA family protein [Patescibacteria group bacterium]MCL5093783.1 TldD/PmbA family protein [Patescibacteria group bacterium]
MVGRQRIHELCHYALKQSSADQTEVLISSVERNLTRFASNSIHQNTSVLSLACSIRVVNDGRVGVASATINNGEDVLKILERANLISKFQQKDPNFKSLPEPGAIKLVNSFSKSTAEITPLEKAKKVKEVIDEIAKGGFQTFGAFDTVVSEVGVANSLGIGVYEVTSVANLSVIAMGKNSSGFAKEVSMDANKINHLKVTKTAIDKALRSKDPIEIEPGNYEVILEEEAVGDMAAYLSYHGFAAKAYHEGRSFLSDKMGKKVLGNNMTIYEDPFDKDTLLEAFDYEGYPKQKLTLIERGILKSIPYDSYTADIYKAKNTGSAFPAPNVFGPLPSRLKFEAGKSTKEEMIKNVKKGLLITRFHYVNAHHHKLLNITGMTRDGTFLIENGKVVAPVKNLRFTQSIPEALSNVLEIGKDLKLVETFGYSLLPALRIKEFNFTSKTEF